jgi:hypothetical protein
MSSDRNRRNSLKWIDGGAPGSKSPTLVSSVSAADHRFWSFVKPVRPEIPAVQETGRVRTPVDAFIIKRLETAGLTLNPDAGRRTLIRRLCFDLVGLPPTPEEIREYLADTSPQAYERLIEQMLSSKHYGER